MRNAIVALTWVALCFGCKQGPVTTGTLRVLNGPTNAVGALSQGLGATRAALDGDPRPNGTYRLSPSTMSFTVIGISLLPEGSFEPMAEVQEVTGCTATYDRSRGSLAVLSECSLTAPVGTYGGITVLYNNTFDVLMNDTEAGIYSDPSAPGQLTTAPPQGGPKPIQVRDRNGESDRGGATLFFETPLTVQEGSPIELYMVFDPTHWMIANLQNGQFSSPQMSGNPPIIPSLSGFGKGAFYSNRASAMSYAQMGGDPPAVGYLFLYADRSTPVSVTWQERDLCKRLGGTHVVSFSGNGTAWGTYGMLGLDPSGTLAWASPGAMVGDRPPRISGYSGVFRMREVSTIGGTTDLTYQCTTDVPLPVSGRNYSSGAPTFTPEDTVTLKLLAQ